MHWVEVIHKNLIHFNLCFFNIHNFFLNIKWQFQAILNFQHKQLAEILNIKASKYLEECNAIGFSYKFASL